MSNRWGVPAGQALCHATRPRISSISKVPRVIMSQRLICVEDRLPMQRLILPLLFLSTCFWVLKKCHFSTNHVHKCDMSGLGVTSPFNWRHSHWWSQFSITDGSVTDGLVIRCESSYILPWRRTHHLTKRHSQDPDGWADFWFCPYYKWFVKKNQHVV